MALSLLRFSRPPVPQRLFSCQKLGFASYNFSYRCYSKSSYGAPTVLFRPRRDRQWFLRRYASTAKVEQMFAAVKINEFKDKALKEGLNDDMLADDDALVQVLEKAGVPGGFAAKARAWARKNAPKPEKKADAAAAGAPPTAKPSAAARPPPPAPTAVVLEAVEKAKLGEWKEAILKTGLSDYTIFNEEEFEKALEKAGVGGGMIMKARAWHRRNLAGKTPPKPPASTDAEPQEEPLPVDEHPIPAHPAVSWSDLRWRVPAITSAVFRGTAAYLRKAKESATVASSATAAPTRTTSPASAADISAMLREELNASSPGTLALARILLMLLLLFMLLSLDSVQRVLRSFEDVPAVGAITSWLGPPSTAPPPPPEERKYTRLTAYERMAMSFSYLRIRHTHQRPTLSRLDLSLPPLRTAESVPTV